MGTNYYIRGHRHQSMDPEVHIGKKSAAGYWCWNCNLTLCKGGSAGVHLDADGWYEACPKCEKKPKKESLEKSSAGRELGFNKGPYKRKTGVASCSSFTWAIDPKKFFEQKIEIEYEGKCTCCGQVLPDSSKVIENEYGDLFTLEEFKQILQECPIQYTDSIGKCFS